MEEKSPQITTIILKRNKVRERRWDLPYEIIRVFLELS